MRFLMMSLLLSAVCSTCVLAKETANFIEGTYATIKGCSMLEKLGNGTKRTISTVPDTLDKYGFHGWEGGCEFTKVFEHMPGKVWTGLMYCVEGNSINAPNMVFVRDEENNSLEVIQAGDENPKVFHRCDVK